MQHLNLSGLPFASKTASGNDNFIHDHDFIEIFFITEGEIVHNILNSSKKLSEGDGVVIAPDVSHYFSRSHSCIHRDNMLSIELFKDCCSFLGIQRALQKKVYRIFNYDRPDKVLRKKRDFFFKLGKRESDEKTGEVSRSFIARVYRLSGLLR